MMRRLLMLLTMVLAANVPGIAYGHEVRPGYLELRQTGAESWRVLWKVPAQGEMRLSMHPRFPESCALASEPIALQAAGAHTERTTIACKGGLVGRAIAIDGLPATMTDVVVRSVRADDSVQIARLTPSAPAFVFEAVPGYLQIARVHRTGRPAHSGPHRSSALRQVGLPESDIPLALFTFSVGVELGQLMFVGTVLLGLAALRGFLSRLPA